MAVSTSKIDSAEFYDHYLGHKVEHLAALLPHLRNATDRLIWLAGDSSLDNKYWFQFTQPAVGAYEKLLDPPRSKVDVAYWLNFLAAKDENLCRTSTINTAVEESTVNQRTFRLLPQDRFIQENIGPNDILIVSVGGNDVADSPTPCTIASILCLVNMPSAILENGCNMGTIRMDDYCLGCSTSLASCACAFPPCLGYFGHLFGFRVEKYIQSLVQTTKPKLVLVCMIYYPDEAQTMSWATAPLSRLGYDRDPKKLQLMIRKAYKEATSAIQVPGTEVIPVPLFSVLDGRRTEEYRERVEPSEIGGKLMAQLFLRIIGEKMYATNVTAPLSQSMISERS